MLENTEKLIKFIYEKYRTSVNFLPQEHPREEAMACFLEGKLNEREEQDIKQHVLKCDLCAQVCVAYAEINLDASRLQVPQGLIEQVKSLVSQSGGNWFLEIFLKLKNGLIELSGTNGDILIGQELLPAPVLRSRQINNFKDEVVVLKDIGSLRVEIKVEKSGVRAFSVIVKVRDKQSGQELKDIRITLLRDNLELESYINDLGRVVFEHIALGRYTIEISDIKERLAAILLDLKN